MTDRRSFLTGLGSTALLGSFLVNDPHKLAVPDRQIVLATETPPEPLGSVVFPWSEVNVQPVDPTRLYSSQSWQAPHTFRGDLYRVWIEGVVEEVHRSEAFYLAAQNGERLKIYFAKA